MNHSRLSRTQHAYQLGQGVLFTMPDSSYEPFLMDAILPNAFGEEAGYMVRSMRYPSIKEKMMHAMYLRPMIRTRSDMKRLLRVVK